MTLIILPLRGGGGNTIPSPFFASKGHQRWRHPPAAPYGDRDRGMVNSTTHQKNILAVSNNDLFQNERLDMLALDPGMVQTWQHVGGAASHSPLSVHRA